MRVIANSICLVLFLFYGCNGKKNNDRQSVSKNQKTVETLSSDTEFTENVKSSCPSFDGYLPFGCDVLTELPDTIIIDLKKIDDPKDYYSKYLNTCLFYQQISKEPNTELPAINKIDNVKAGLYYPFNDSISPSLDSSRYKLPNFGPYECFYSYRNFILEGIVSYEKNKALSDWSEGTYVSDIGNLIFYDPLSKTAKAFLIYYSTNNSSEEAEGSDTYRRLFYIGKDKVLKVYGIIDTGVWSLVTIKLDYAVDVKDDGQIIVKNSSGKTTKTYER